MPETQPESAAMKPNRRWHHIVPGHLLMALFLLEGILWLWEHGWLPFNQYPGWPLLITVVAMGGTAAGIVLWFAASLVFRWRFQFSVRFLLAAVAMVATLCSWLTVEMKAAGDQRATVEVMESHDIEYLYDYQTEPDAGEPEPPGPTWLHDLLGIDFFAHVVSVSAFGDDGLECLTRLSHLKKLTLSDDEGFEITDAALEDVGKLARLEELTISSKDITDDGLEHLQGLTSLRTLCISSEQITDDGLKHLVRLGTLRRLDLGCFEVKGPGLQYIGKLTGLEELSLAYCFPTISNADIANLSGLCRLNRLDIGNSNVDDAGLEYLQGMTELEALSVAGCPISDAGLVRLKGFARLRRLDLRRTRITDSGLKSVKGLAQLECLCLGSDTISDAGLEHLTSLRKLQELWLLRTDVTDQGRKKLQQALPNCKIDCPTPSKAVSPPLHRHGYGEATLY